MPANPSLPDPPASAAESALPGWGPQRIVCLTEETTETLYRLGEQDRIVGISGFTVRPPQARKEKPKVSAFTSAKTERIADLKPDLVLGFSDLQADIAAELIRAGIPVHVFNQRSVAEILEFIRMLGAMVGAQARTAALLDELQRGLDEVQAASAKLPCRPRVYFEEWDEPMISAIRWVSELITIAGGEDVFPELALEPGGKARIIADPNEVCHAVIELLARHDPALDVHALENAFLTFTRLHAGDLPGYAAADTPYHDAQHSLDCALGAARLIEGHERGVPAGHARQLQHVARQHARRQLLHARLHARRDGVLGQADGGQDRARRQNRDQSQRPQA